MNESFNFVKGFVDGCFDSDLENLFYVLGEFFYLSFFGISFLGI